MDPTEIIKHIPGAAAAIASSSIVADVVKKILGPAADEVGEWGRDKIKAYRTRNATKVLEEAGTMLHEAKIEPRTVEPKFLLTVLEAASLEDDEIVRRMWAALLANAAKGVPQSTRPIFVTTLRGLAPDEAILLQQLAISTLAFKSFEEDLRLRIPETFAQMDSTHHEITRLSAELLHEFANLPNEDENAKVARFEICIHTLWQAGLADSAPPYRVSNFGFLFLACVTPPKPAK